MLVFKELPYTYSPPKTSFMKQVRQKRSTKLKIKDFVLKYPPNCILNLDFFIQESTRVFYLLEKMFCGDYTIPIWSITWQKPRLPDELPTSSPTSQPTHPLQPTKGATDLRFWQ